jgi:hypothetical protein
MHQDHFLYMYQILPVRVKENTRFGVIGQLKVGRGWLRADEVEEDGGGAGARLLGELVERWKRCTWRPASRAGISRISNP